MSTRAKTRDCYVNKQQGENPWLLSQTFSPLFNLNKASRRNLQLHRVFSNSFYSPRGRQTSAGLPLEMAQWHRTPTGAASSMDFWLSFRWRRRPLSERQWGPPGCPPPSSDGKMVKSLWIFFLSLFEPDPVNRSCDPQRKIGKRSLKK